MCVWGDMAEETEKGLRLVVIMVWVWKETFWGWGGWFQNVLALYEEVD